MTMTAEAPNDLTPVVYFSSTRGTRIREWIFVGPIPGQNIPLTMWTRFRRNDVAKPTWRRTNKRTVESEEELARNTAIAIDAIMTRVTAHVAQNEQMSDTNQWKFSEPVIAQASTTQLLAKPYGENHMLYVAKRQIDKVLKAREKAAQTKK